MGDRVRIWCLRHAESENIVAGTTAVSTTPLTAWGRHQAIEAARQLAAEPITKVYASTAVRAQQTATIVAITLRLPVAAMPALVEVGCSAEVLHAWVVEQDLGRRAADGETGHQVAARMTTALQQIAGAHPGETVAVVGHVASLTVALGKLCALGPAVWGTPLPHALPLLVEWDGDAWRCPTWPTAR